MGWLENPDVCHKNNMALTDGHCLEGRTRVVTGDCCMGEKSADWPTASKTCDQATSEQKSCCSGHVCRGATSEGNTSLATDNYWLAGGLNAFLIRTQLGTSTGSGSVMAFPPTFNCNDGEKATCGLNVQFLFESSNVEVLCEKATVYTMGTCAEFCESSKSENCPHVDMDTSTEACAQYIGASTSKHRQQGGAKMIAITEFKNDEDMDQRTKEIEAAAITPVTVPTGPLGRWFFIKPYLLREPQDGSIPELSVVILATLNQKGVQPLNTQDQRLCDTYTKEEKEEPEKAKQCQTTFYSSHTFEPFKIRVPVRAQPDHGLPEELVGRRGVVDTCWFEYDMDNGLVNLREEETSSGKKTHFLSGVGLLLALTMPPLLLFSMHI